MYEEWMLAGLATARTGDTRAAIEVRPAPAYSMNAGIRAASQSSSKRQLLVLKAHKKRGEDRRDDEVMEDNQSLPGRQMRQPGSWFAVD